MNSASPDFTLRFAYDPLSDRVSAFQTALELFGTAELSEFLPPSDDPRLLETLAELVCIDMKHGWRTGTPMPLEAYRASFPGLFADPILAYRIGQEEYRCRQEAGDISQAPALSPLDPAVSSKFDLTFDPDELAKYPATTGIENDYGPPSAIIETRLAVPGERRGPAPSDPEVVWKLKESMQAMPKVGDEFLGFGLLAELGSGAFSRVFLAQQGQLAGRLVALKIATGLFGESQTLAQLQHTHIVPIYSYHHGQPFQAVCMPYLGSTTLAHVLADIRTQENMPSSGKELLSTLNVRRKSTRHLDDSSRNVMDPAREVAEPTEDSRLFKRSPAALELEGMSYVDSILWLAVRLADGLAHAHQQGIIHRDLKPANILLTDDGVPMLLDFNLAQDNKAGRSAASASIGGTLPYMAPEHLEAFRGQGRSVDARSDLYSLGVILFELLTGVAPFPTYRKLSTRETVERMIQDRLRGAPPLRELNPSISPAVEAIVRRCLQADPVQRYQRARELQQDLQCQLEHEPLVHAENPSLRERCQKFRMRHPRLTSVASMAAGALLLIAGLASVFAVREEQHRRLQARETLASFQDTAQTAYFLLNARSAKDQLEEGQRACRAALDEFQVLDSAKWRDGPAASRLSKDDQGRLSGEVGQLLVLLAHAQQLAGECETDTARRRGLFQEGLQLCSRATDCFGDGQIPQSLWKQQGELHQRLNQREKAQQAFERARQSALKTAQDRFLAAKLLAEEGRFRDALPLVREGVRLNPQDFNLHFLQGICHDYLGQYADAIACYGTCVALRPKFYGAYFNRGLVYMRQERPEAALTDFDEVLRLHPNFGDLYVPRALALTALAKHADAIADLNEALERNPGQTRIYFLRATVRKKAGDIDGSKQDFAEGLHREPADDQSFVARGIAWLPAEPKKALADFDTALRLDHRSLAALHNKAHVLAKYFKRIDEAVETLDKAVQLYPDDARPRAGRSLYLARLGRREDALKDAEQAMALDNSAAIQYELAGVFALTSRQQPNDRHEAIRLLSAALKKGYGFDHLDTDKDLDPIRATPAFRELTQGVRALQSAPR